MFIKFKKSIYLSIYRQYRKCVSVRCLTVCGIPLHAWKRSNRKNDVSDEKTCDLVCSSYVSLLSASRGARFDWKSWRTAFLLDPLEYLHTPFAVDPHFKLLSPVNFMLLWYELLMIELVINMSFKIYIDKTNPAQIWLIVTFKHFWYAVLIMIGQSVQWNPEFASASISS